MNVSKDIYEAHRRLSRCSADFIKFIEDNPESLDRSNFQGIISEKSYAYFRSQPWPTFISESIKAEMSTAAVKVYDLITSIPGRLFGFDRDIMSRYYNISQRDMEKRLYGLDEFHMSGLLGRGDFVLSPSGRLKCLEFNMSPSLGGWGMDFLEPLYLQTPVISRFLKQYGVRLKKNNLFRVLLGRLVERALARFGGADAVKNEINIAIAFPKYVENIMGPLNRQLNDLYAAFLKQKNSDIRGDIYICDINHLQWENNSLVLGGKKIHSLIEMCYGEIPIFFMELVKNGELLIYNGPITLLMSNKLNLAILSECRDSGEFTREERDAIREYIPWTRKLTAGETTYEGQKIRLEEFVLSRRERLVIKPARGFGGKGVYLGFDTPPEQWKQIVEIALVEKDRVVQEYVEMSSYLYQVGEQGCGVREAVWGFFVFASLYAGGFVRMIPDAHKRGIINAGQGAEESIVLEVEER